MDRLSFLTGKWEGPWNTGDNWRKCLQWFFPVLFIIIFIKKVDKPCWMAVSYCQSILMSFSKILQGQQHVYLSLIMYLCGPALNDLFCKRVILWLLPIKNSCCFDLRMMVITVIDPLIWSSAITVSCFKILLCTCNWFVY